MGGLKPEARSALVKWMVPTSGSAGGNAATKRVIAGYPVTKAIQSWQVVQPLHKTDTPWPPFSARPSSLNVKNGQSSGIAT